MDEDANTPPRHRAISDTLSEEAERASNQLLTGVCAIALVGVPLSVSRAFFFGWNPIYALHLASLAIVLALYVRRHQLTVRQKSGTILALAMLVSLAGMVNLGLYGNGAMWGTFAVFIASMFLRQKAVLAIAGAFMLIFLATAWGYVGGHLEFPFDPQRYLRSPLAWGVAIAGSFFFVVLIIIIDSNHKATTQRLILELERKTRQLATMADQDHLTGLANLRALKARVDGLLAEDPAAREQTALFFIDLDGFKAINDAHGHDAGDHVLKAVAGRLLAIVREHDLVARIGGDEFVILLRSSAASPLPALDGFAQRVVDTVARPISCHGLALNVGASVGVTVLTSGDDSYDDAVRRADRAMYAAKNEGKNGFRLA